MPRYAVAYGRVSTEMQTKFRISGQVASIAEQFATIDRWCVANDVQIVYRDRDEGVSAYADQEAREGFWRAINYAKSDRRVSLFLIDDSSRFIRDQYEAGEVKADLRRHHIWAKAVNEDFDPRTITGVYMEAITGAKNQARSMEDSYNTHRGMRANIAARDPESGWCYKNGGPPAYGYRIVHVKRGVDARGREIVKSLWEVDDEKLAVLRWIAEQKLAGASFDNIRDSLNGSNNPWGRPVPGPRGGAWRTHSMSEMFHRDRLEEYTGIEIWNKQYNHHNQALKPRGQKFKPESEWIRVENAHPPIFTSEEAAAIRAAIDRLLKAKPHIRTRYSRWLLTGPGAAGHMFFICAHCGAAMTGYDKGGRHLVRYKCGSMVYSGVGCRHDAEVLKDLAESAVYAAIQGEIRSEERLQRIVDKVNRGIDDDEETRTRAERMTKKELEETEAGIRRLLDALKAGVNPLLVKQEIDVLAVRKAELEQRLANLHSSIGGRSRLALDDLKAWVAQMESLMESGDNESRRALARAFIEHIEYDADEKALRLFMFDGPVATIPPDGPGGSKQKTPGIPRGSMCGKLVVEAAGIELIPTHEVVISMPMLQPASCRSVGI